MSVVLPKPEPALWIERYGDELYRFALGRVANDEVGAEELVQETLLSALQGLNSFRGEASERTWLFLILRRKIIDHYRRQARHPHVSLAEVTPAGPTEADFFENRQRPLAAGAVSGQLAQRRRGPGAAGAGCGPARLPAEIAAPARDRVCATVRGGAHGRRNLQGTPPFCVQLLGYRAPSQAATAALPGKAWPGARRLIFPLFWPITLVDSSAMLRFISCQRATLLIEQRTDMALSATERNSLWLHLRYCPYCHRYGKQTALLNHLAKVAAAHRAASATLSDEARQRLRAQLAAAQPKPEPEE